MLSLKPSLQLISASALLFLSACMHQSASTPVPELNLSGKLPEVSAQYVSISKTDDATSQQSFRIWRQPQRLLRENLDTQITDIWQRDGNHLNLKKYFHAEQRGVEFQHDDLRMLNIEPQWTSTQWMLDVAVLKKLPLVKSAWQHNVPVQTYQGKIDDTSWTIKIRTDLMVPTLIEHKNKHQQHSTRLIAAQPLPQAQWQPGVVENADFIDFADFGDKEYDPFVKKVEAVLGMAHSH